MKKNSSINSFPILHSLYFSLLAVLVFNPTYKLAVKKFTRRIGMGILADYDVSVLIRHFYLWIFAFAVLLVIFYVIFDRIREWKQDVDRQKAWKFLDGFSVIAFTSLCLSCVTYFQDGRIVNGIGKYAVFFSVTVYFAAFLYILLPYKKISPKVFHQTVVSLFAFSCYASYLISFRFRKPSALFVLFVLLICAASIFLLLAERIAGNAYLVLFFDFLSAGATFLPLALSFCIEGIYILNQHSVYVMHIKYVCLGIFLLSCVMAAIYALINARKRPHVSLWRDSWVYPVIIAGIVLCTNQPKLQGIYFPNIFESANYSILINDFLNFGKIPIVEHYGGHMLLNVVSGIFYGLANNDFSGAVVSPYWNYFFPALCAVLFFLFIREIIGSPMAFFTCLLIPYESFCATYFSVGLPLCIAVIKFMDENTRSRALLIWVAFVYAVLSKLDVGFAFFGGTVCVLLFYCIKEKKLSAAKILLQSFASVAFFMGALWCLLCAVKGITPVSRLHEFCDISSSNPSWAYTTLGDKSSLAYFWTYCFLPLAICAATVYTVFSGKVRKNWFNHFFCGIL